MACRCRDRSTLGVGALAIGDVKYKTQAGLFKRMLEEKKPLALDFRDAFALAREIVGAKPAGAKAAAPNRPLDRIHPRARALVRRQQKFKRSRKLPSCSVELASRAQIRGLQSRRWTTSSRQRHT